MRRKAIENRLSYSISAELWARPTLHLRKALQGLAASGHPFRVSLSATPQAGSPSAAANASRWA
jgi:hypothetical protein